MGRSDDGKRNILWGCPYHEIKQRLTITKKPKYRAHSLGGWGGGGNGGATELIFDLRGVEAI